MTDKTNGAKQYNKLRVRLKLFDICLSLSYLVLFQLVVSHPLNRFSYSITDNYFFALGLYMIVFCVLYYLIDFPLHFYSSYLTERKFKLSNQNVFNWFRDDLKNNVLSFVLFMVFVGFLYLVLRNFKTTWWVWIACFWFIVTILVAKITPIILLPLFFKYSPVTDKLRENIMALSKKCDIRIIDVYKIDFSKKTNKLNAAVIGIGNTRRVVLADNLIESFTDEEVEGVLCHEFGHHKLMHMWKIMLFGLLSTLISFYVLYLISYRVIGFFGGEAVYDVSVFPIFMLILFLVGFLTLPLQNWFSRKLEKEADIFALKTTRNKKAFVSLMEKLAKKNLADPNPPMLVKILFYTHPPVSERIKMAENFN